MVDVFSNCLCIKGVNRSWANFMVDVFSNGLFIKGVNQSRLTSQWMFLATVFIKGVNW